jgi:hypothetical protein
MNACPNTIEEQKVISFSTPMIESSDDIYIYIKREKKVEEQLRLREQLLSTSFK